MEVTGAVDEATVEVLERAVVAVGDDLPGAARPAVGGSRRRAVVLGRPGAPSRP